MTENDKLKVVVVGGGLVGSLFACFLARKGYHVDLYEQREDIRLAKQTAGRSINLALSIRGREALRVVGLEQIILASAIPMKGRLIHDISGRTKSIPYDKLTNQCIYSISRNYLNGLLLSAAESYPNVSLHFQHRLISANPQEGSVTLLNMKTNERIHLLPDLIVGADGSHSSIRLAMQQSPFFQYSQTYIDHGYLELRIKPEDGYKMTPNHLHIWPRGEFMLIALPNHDGSWTVTLFMPFERFQIISTPQEVSNFFKTNFPDAISLIGEGPLLDTFAKIKPSYLVSIKCSPYNINNFVIIGDAAHAMVPFYGQGMNAGFEDCILLDKLLEKHRNSIQEAIGEFSIARVDDAQAISDLAMYNYVEMRELVTKYIYHLRKQLDEFLFRIVPTIWIPLYHSVTFTRTNYKKCIENRQWQNKVIRNTLFVFLMVILFIGAVITKVGF